MLWWRRTPSLPHSERSPEETELINNDVRTAVEGLLRTSFHGRLVDDPRTMGVAENKLVQLRTAADCGFRIPETLVSQDPQEIRSFCERLRHDVVAKPVRGTNMAPLLTGKVEKEHLAKECAMQISPVIYQAFIPGSRHLRVHCFGERVLCALIQSPDLDWRRGYSRLSLQPYSPSDSFVEDVLRWMHSLGLTMGVLDFKLDEDGEPVCLEVNPQGQFLWVEGMCGLPLSRACAEFFREQINNPV